MTNPELRTSKRRWFKMYPNECINGSIRWQLSPAERSVWYDLLSFASICSNVGLIADRDGKPIPHNFIANRLNITIQLFNSALEKCKAEGRILEDETGMHITNWDKYQSEYDRQKPYRESKKVKAGIDFNSLHETVKGAASVHELNAIAGQVHDAREEMGDFEQDSDLIIPEEDSIILNQMIAKDKAKHQDNK